MAETLTLSQLLDAVVMTAGIDGQTSSGGRHSTSRLTDLFNRTWSNLRGLVCRAGLKELLAEDTGTIPAAATNEEYSVIPWPTTASEVHSVDVFVSGCWERLEPIDRANLRTWRLNPSCGGAWAVNKLPKESTTTVTAGEIAVLPSSTLAGTTYKVAYLEHWTPISSSNTSYVIIGYPDWFTWAILSMSEVVAGRDNNKKGMLVEFSRLKKEAEDRIIAGARRFQRAGPIVPRRRDGLEL